MKKLILLASAVVALLRGEEKKQPAPAPTPVLVDAKLRALYWRAKDESDQAEAASRLAQAKLAAVIQQMQTSCGADSALQADTRKQTDTPMEPICAVLPKKESKAEPKQPTDASKPPQRAETPVQREANEHPTADKTQP